MSQATDSKVAVKREAECEIPKGVAPIKREFLVLVKDQVINWDYVPDDVAPKVEGQGEKRPIDDRDIPGNHKKFKLKGQNKNKDRYKIGRKNRWSRGQKLGDSGQAAQPRVERGNRLCLKLLDSQGDCPYRSKCEYSHDPYKIFKSVEPDLLEDEPCYIYSTYGRCQFGVTCLFSKNHMHLNDEQKTAYNLIDHSRWSLGEGRRCYQERVSNRLDNLVQYKLRKKAYDFKIVDDVMNRLYKADMEDTSNEDENKVDDPNHKRIGAALVDEFWGSRDVQRRKVDFKGKLYLAPLTTVGNLPFRRLCKRFSCDITCAEMSLCTSLLQGNPSEWSHLRRHESEDVFGVQITTNHGDQGAKVVKVLNEHCDIDFIDINCGCPTDFICQSGAGAGLMQRASKLRKLIAGSCMVSKVPITIKMRSGCAEGKNNAHSLIKSIINPFTSKYIGAVTVHGRSRNQRYTKMADWDYVNQCGEVIDDDIALIGSGDCISWQEYYQRLEDHKNISGVMIARGALISPWLFTEIKERRTWDISSRERLDIVKDYVNYGLDLWGSDPTGVETCRKYLLEWLSFSCRYIPAGLLEVLPQRINDRPPKYKGRDELETLLSSPAASDWVKISEMFLGKVPENFKFLPKHKSNAYESVVEG